MRTRAVLLLIICIVGAWLIAAESGTEPRAMTAPLATFPMTLGDWRGVEQPPFDEETLKVLGLNDYLTRVYVSERAGVGLYVGFWESQHQGDTIHSPLNCLPGAGWEPISKDLLELPAGGAQGTPVTVNRYVVQKGLERQLVLYWYQSHGRIVASEYTSRAYLVADAIRLHRTDAAIVRIIVPIQSAAPGESAAEQQGVRFARTLLPVLGGYLPS